MRLGGIVRLGLVAAALAAALATLRAWERTEGRPRRLPEQVEGWARVVDGDTLRIGRLAIRLAGVDAPELAQGCARADRTAYPCGEAAREALERLIDGRPVACRLRGRDRYRRALARCEVEGEDLGAALVRAGLALGYRGGYAQEEAQARARRAGLWAGSFERPEEWRRERRARAAR